MLWNNPSAHRVGICHYDWFNKQAEWPIAEQDKVRQDSQTENDGMRKGRVRELPARWRTSRTHKMR